MGRINMYKWHRRFMELAELVATWSKDPSTQVGAVLASDNDVLSMGYNGFPQRTPDEEKFLHDRKEKYPRTVHAEVNAILRMPPIITDSMVMYSTHFPCSSCAAIIIASGVKKVCARPPAKDFQERWPDIQISRTMFEEAGIQIIFIDK